MFKFDDIGIFDIQHIINNFEKISKTYNVAFQEKFLTNLKHLQNVYKSFSIANEGNTKIILESNKDTVPKIFKWKVQFDQEAEFYNILVSNGFRHYVADTTFYNYYAIQEKLAPLQNYENVPSHLKGILHDEGPQQLGKDELGNIKILDFENVNLNTLNLEETKVLKKILSQK